LVEREENALRHHHLALLNMTTSLDWLKQTGTIVVSDSGDFECTSSSFVSVLSSYHNSH